jgi:hypothetical protein
MIGVLWEKKRCTLNDLDSSHGLDDDPDAVFRALQPKGNIGRSSRKQILDNAQENCLALKRGTQKLCLTGGPPKQEEERRLFLGRLVHTL